MDIECKYCGNCIGTVTPLTSGPHKNRVDCSACGKFHKWAASVDIQDLSIEQIANAINISEWKAIHYARDKDIGNFYKETNLIDKLLGFIK
jgi:hypothetical protein